MNEEEKLSKPLVSVIVPLYKSEKRISYCIESILSQTYGEIEVLLVLDGVFDNSLIICKKYKEVDRRIRIIEISHSGVSVARNRGIEASQGEWIAFIDSDDWIDDNYIESLLSVGINTGSDIVISGYCSVDIMGEKKNSFMKTRVARYCESKDDIIQNCIMCTDKGNRNSATNIGVPWAKLYKSELLIRNDITFSPGLVRMQDMVFNLYAMYYAKTITAIEEYGYHYYINDSASTHSFQPTFNLTAETILAEIDKYIEETGIEYLDEIMREKAVLLAIEMIELQFLHEDCKLNRKEKILRLKKIMKRDGTFYKCIQLAQSEFLSNKQNLARILLKYRMFCVLFFLEEMHYKKKNGKVIVLRNTRHD